MTTISPIKYEVEIHEPLSTPVPMPPSMLSSEALVIWMFRIAMNAPIMAARIAIQTLALALSAGAAGRAGAAGAAAGVLETTSLMDHLRAPARPQSPAQCDPDPGNLLPGQ